MHYALYIMHYALCIMHCELCIVPALGIEAEILRSEAVQNWSGKPDPAEGGGTPECLSGFDLVSRGGWAIVNLTFRKNGLGRVFS